MAKALSQSDVTHEIERWAATMKKLRAAEAVRDKEIQPLTDKYEAAVAEINKLHDPKIDKLQANADEIETKIREWLDGKTKTTVIDTKHAVAEVVHGSKNGVRVPDLKKLTALCKKKSVDFWQFVTVALGKLDKALGETEVNTICEIPTVPTKVVNLRLKD